MTKKLYILALFTIVSIGLYAYLAKDYYNVQYLGPTGESICSINSTFNCEAVAESDYSHLFFGIPNALVGLFVQIAMLIALFALLVKRDDEKDFQNWFSFYFTLSSLHLLAAALMAYIAFILMDVYCLFCISLYVLAGLNFALTFLIFKSLKGKVLFEIFKSKVFIALLALIPAASFLSHQIVKKNYSPEALEREIDYSLKAWQKNKAHDFSGTEALLVFNPGAKVKVVEFADFLCPHCSKAFSTLKKFTETHKDLELSFYTYPLDPACNPSLDPKYKGPGYSCTLSAGVYCAKKQSQGVSLYSDIFENQRDYAMKAQASGNEGLQEKMLQHLGESVDVEAWKSCLASNEAKGYIEKSGPLGKEAGVQGTPTVYMNGKKLNGGAHYLILKKAYQSLK